MKKFIAIIAVLALSGCGGANEELTTTETTTEVTTETSTEEIFTVETYEEETFESKTVAESENEVETAKESKSFADSEEFGSIKEFAESAGFDTTFSGDTLTVRTYITDDTIDYIKEKDTGFADRWDEMCGKYEELGGEIIGMTNDDSINVVIEVVGRSDNKVYFKNENGVSVFNGYNS